MTPVRYTGVLDAHAEFEALRPLVLRLGQLRIKCRPFGSDYNALSVAIAALETTAFHFTRNPNFFHERQGHSS